MPTTSHPAVTGPAHMNWYKSEFGCVAWSSFESMSNQLPEDQWSLHSDAAYYRNWPVDLVIRAYFGQQDFSATGRAPFQKQLYQSMLGQALNHKATIESCKKTRDATIGPAVLCATSVFLMTHWSMVGLSRAGDKCFRDDDLDV